MAAGFFGFFLEGINIQQPEAFFPNFKGVFEAVQTDQYQLGRKVLPQLSHDRFLQENDEFIIGFEGINLTPNIQTFNEFVENYKEKGLNFIPELKGTFSGFILDKKKQKIHIYTDHLATKSIFYYHHPKHGFAFSSSLQVLSKAFRQNNIPYTLNQSAVYMMALYGIMLEDYTYIKEVKRLAYGSILTYDLTDKKMSVNQYFRFNNKKNDLSYQESIDRIENLMTKSIEANWAKNRQYSQQYFSFLSGGMDARVNALLAKEMGFENITTFTFGQSDSKDVEYARKIAQGEGFKHIEHFIDGGNYLTENIFENYVIPNDGMIFYNGSAHMSHSLRSIDLSNFVLAHSGQIGDALFGSFARRHYNFFANKDKIGYTGFVKHIELLNKIEGLDDILAKYQKRGYELYVYEQRIMNGAIMGDKSIDMIMDTISPFYDRDLIQFCISMPNSYKKYQRIYFDWLKKYHPQVLKYPWDKINMNPDAYWKIKYGKLFKKYFNGAKKYFNLKYESMNPFGRWLKENPHILETLNSIFESEINNPNLNTELKEDLKKIYKDDVFESRNKFAVVSVLLAIKLHFSNN
ncbi:MAG TPA: hypothetical protein ENK64_01320 [Flavobacteriales bacterium]|nr:hypothetical protein [Flavobacteriales bacterium]